MPVRWKEIQLNRTRASNRLAVLSGWLLSSLMMHATADGESTAEPPSRVARELKMAEAAIFQVALHRNENMSPELRTQLEISAELGMIVIGRQSTPESDKALVNMLGWQLDGDLAEDHACFLLSRSSRVVTLLNDANVASVLASCHLRAVQDGGTSERAVKDVCAAAEQMKRSMQELLKSIQQHRTCDSDDF